MNILQITVADIVVWRDVLLPIVYVATAIYGTIIISKQVATLKEQVNSQKEIIDRTKTYFEIFDINKIKEYASLTEENGRLKAEKNLNDLNDQIKLKEAELNSKTKDVQELSALQEETRNNIMSMKADVAQLELGSKLPFYKSRLGNYASKTFRGPDRAILGISTVEYLENLVDQSYKPGVSVGALISVLTSKVIDYDIEIPKLRKQDVSPEKHNEFENSISHNIRKIISERLLYRNLCNKYGVEDLI